MNRLLSTMRQRTKWTLLGGALALAVAALFIVLRWENTTRVPTEASKQRPFKNSLGMKFVPAGTERVLFCVWDTRVKDFEAFVKATEYDAVRASLYSQIRGLHSADGAFSKDRTWKSPGFKQGSRNPVVGVNWYDAQEFCRWLTQKEQREGLLTQKQSYRLPTDEEWSRAVGNGKYPWGDEWPPPSTAGNYNDEDAEETPLWVRMRAPLLFRSFSDGYPETSPVGTFKPNGFGLYDMGGNVWQWCQDRYRPEMNHEGTLREYSWLGRQIRFSGDNKETAAFRVTRGGSWNTHDASVQESSYRSYEFDGQRSTQTGFRCVLWLRLP